MVLQIYSLQVFGLKVVEVELGKSKVKAYFLVNCLVEASETLDWYFNTYTCIVKPYITVAGKLISLKWVFYFLYLHTL